MPEYDLAFSPISIEEAGTFKLLELPLELNTLIETAVQNSGPLSLSIKGSPNEDAVLCTKDKTYTIRSVNLSNTILVVTAPEDAAHSLELAGKEDTVVIRDQLNEILELAPAVPKTQKLVARIRGREYSEDQEEEPEDEVNDGSRFTLEEAREEIQASDVELDLFLKQRRILILNRELRPLAPAYMHNILELILNVLVSLSQPHSSVSVEALTSTLSEDHEISRVVSIQVLSWFGEIQTGKWKMNVEEVIKELGLGLLRGHKEPIAKEVFLSNWRETVGDTFVDQVSMTLMAGNYLEQKSPITEVETLLYFPSSALPSDPAARFADLFLTRSKWKADEISTFLNDIAVNTKERDKLLLKYCRAITEGGAVWYTARVQYSG